MKKRMPTPKDGLRVGADLTLGFIASLIDAMVRKGRSAQDIRTVMYAACSDHEVADLIGDLAYRHLSAPVDPSDAQMERDHAELMQRVAEHLKTKGVDLGFGLIVSKRLS